MSYHQRPKDWHLAHKIKINSLEHLNSLTADGFEVKVIKFYGHPQNMNCALLLVKGEEQLAADGNSINEYVMRLRELYDFDSGKTRFVYIPDTKIYHEFEEEMFNLLPSLSYGLKSEPITKRKLDSTFWKVIISRFEDWIRMEKDKKYGIKNLSEIFFLACLIYEKAGIITRKTISKEEITLNKIRNIVKDARDYDNCIIFSPFFLSPKTDGKNNVDDMLVGIIIYDIKNNQTLAFNILSLVSFNNEHGVAENAGLYDVVNFLSKQTLSGDLLSSYLPTPIDSPYYTAMPWICYSMLLPISLDEQVNEQTHKLSLPEFFVFGYTSLPNIESSFIFSNFSIHKEGRAVCVLNFNDSKGRIKFTMRFDQSLGQRLVHIDFSFYNGKEIKLIAHRPLDFEEVYRFNFRLFIGMMLAGIFDSYFSTLVKGGILGLKKLAEENAAFLYPYYWIWMIESFVKRLNEDERNYIILSKLYKGMKIDKREKEFIEGLQIGSFNVASRDIDGSINGLSALGYVVLVRYNRGHANISAF